MEMEFFNSKKFIAILLVVLFVSVLSGCAKKPLVKQEPKQPTTLESVAKMKSIGAMIGCVFAPTEPECQKLRKKKAHEKPHQSQEEYIEEVNKEFDDLEKDLETRAE